MSRHNLKRYDEERKNLKSGDILLFSGKGFISWVIKKFTKSTWSHVGIVYHLQKEDIIFIFESTTLNMGMKGSQIMELSRRIRIAKGKIYYRSLNKPLTELQLRKFRDMRKNLLGKPYEKSIVDLFLAGMGASRQDGTGLQWPFCSELVAGILQHLRILKKSRRASSYAPRDFSSGSSLADQLKEGYQYGPEIPLN